MDHNGSSLRLVSKQTQFWAQWKQPTSNTERNGILITMEGIETFEFFIFVIIVEASSFVLKKNPFITKNSGEMSVVVPCMTY